MLGLFHDGGAEARQGLCDESTNMRAYPIEDAKA